MGHHFARAAAAGAIALGFLFACGVAQAANIHIDASNPASVTISWTDFDRGNFTVNGNSYPFPGYGQTQSVTVSLSGENPQLTFGGNWITNGGASSSTTLYFVDPGTTHVRGLLIAGSELGGGQASINGSFATDVPTDLGSLPAGATAVQITGTSQELVGTYLNVPANLTFQVVAQFVAANPTLGNTSTSTNPSGGTSTILNRTVTEAVNTATGNTYVKFSDLLAPGKGLRFDFIRSYNDQDSYSGPLCGGWTHSYNILLSADTSGAVTIKEGDGHQDVFQPGAGSGSFTSPPGDFDILASTGTNTYTLKRPDQTVLAFGPIPANPAIIRLLTITDKNGNTQSLSYDSNGNLITFTDIGGGTFTFTYDGLFHLTALRNNALQKTLSYACDATGTDLVSYVDADGKTSSYSYTANLLGVVTDPRTDTAINNSFDSRGRVTQTTRIMGTQSCTTTYSYNDAAHVTTITDPYQHQTRHFYDTSTPSHLVKVVNALGYQTTFTYDGNNDLTSMTNPLGQTTSYTYDAHGNRTTAVDPLSHVTSFGYDSLNDLIKMTDANGTITLYAYDGTGNLKQVMDAVGGITNFAYDPRGNKLSLTNANGKTTNYTYDGSNRPLKTTILLGKLTLTTALTYDAFGRLSTQTEPAGNQKSLGYDGLGRITSIGYTKGTLASLAGPVSYTYDANGNRLTMTDSTGTTSYTYDTLNRVTAITFPGNRTVTYAYDCNDNRTSMTYAGKTVNFTYDAIDRLTAVGDGRLTTTYKYDAANNVLSVAYPNNATVAYTYDGAGRITQVQNGYSGSSSPSPSPISTFTYVLDNVGNRTQVTDGSGNVTAFTYDKLYRLTNAAVVAKPAAYTYDPVGNRLTLNAPATSTPYSYDAADRLTAAGSTPLTWDDNGNLVSKGSGGANVTYAYDSADRLVSVTGGGLTASSFAYDGDGNRVSQKVGTGTYAYLNDIATPFSTVLQETGPDGTIAYVRGRGLISADGPNFTYFYHYDAQSTVAGVTDTTGHLAQRYVYDVWGSRNLSVPGPQVGTLNKFAYTGEALDPGTSLYFLRARYYDPSLGRFINQDTFAGTDRMPQTLNRFVYARNNPATLTDRTGLCSEWDGFADCDLLWPGAPDLP